MPTALLSVYHKEGIVAFAQELLDLGWNLIASGGTANALRESQLPVRDVASLVGGDAILGHRVVTLSREVHAGLLARPVENAAEMANLGLPYIDLVCVDLYPLETEVQKPDHSLAQVIEMTDIGGPTLLRAAAKGNRIVIGDPADRSRVLQWLKDNQPEREKFVNELAAKAEFIVSRYGLTSAHYRSNSDHDGILGHKVHNCCYGENRWQSPAALFSTRSKDPLALDRFDVILGTAPSYVNWRDLDRLLQTVTHIAAVLDHNHQGAPLIAVGCKHGNPCGAAFGIDPTQVIRHMVVGDPLALFGGMVMTNFTITSLVAELLLTADGRRVLDGVAAPSFDAGALESLRRKNQRCRLYQNPALAHLSSQSLNQVPLLVPVRGGFLRQPNYTFVLDRNDSRLEKHGVMTEPQETDLLLAWALGSTSTSNTVTLVKNGVLIGNGVGQQDRVGACTLAVHRAKRSQHNTQGSVAYSDSFFPYIDGPAVLAEAGVEALLTSSGSVKDKEVRAYCAEHDIALWMIPDAVGRGFYGH